MKELVTAPRSRGALHRTIAISVGLTVLGITLSTLVSLVISSRLTAEEQRSWWAQAIAILPFIPVFFAAQMGSQAWVKGRPSPQTGAVPRALRKARLGDEYTLIREPVDSPVRPVSVDCVLVGPSGVHVFLPYRARGEFRVLRDVWFSRDRHGRERKLDTSPVREATRRAVAIKTWLAKNGVVGLPVQPWVLVSGGKKARVERPSCPVVRPEDFLAAWEKQTASRTPLADPGQRQQLVSSLVAA